MTHANKPERLQIILTAEELTALDDWRFANRMPSRAADIRALLRRGMVQAGGAAVTDGSGRHSRDVRIVEQRGNGAHIE